jgi:isopentenyl phosphate kinase
MPDVVFAHQGVNIRKLIAMLHGAHIFGHYRVDRLI